MFRIDSGFIHPIIPNLPVALIPIIPNPSPCTGPSPVRASQSDEFRMYEFKVKRCPVSRAHDWTVCPWAHPGERARRRDPRHVLYKAVPCEEFRAHQRCRRGDGCEYAHGVFEYWLHPARYRTRACTSGAACTRKVCFFAHAPGELRARTRYPFEPDEGSKTTTTVHVPLEGEVLESVRRLSTRDAMSKSSSDRSDLMECEGDDFEMPDVEWIRDLIG